MLSSLEILKSRCRGLGLFGAASVVTAFSLLALTTGCPPAPPSGNGNTSGCETNADCGDMQLCIDSVCEDVDCTADADCDDDTFCNGAETCDLTDGTCSDGTEPCGPTETCDEDADECVAAPECDADEDCDDGDACTGTETCDLTTSLCVDGTAVVVDDGVFCNGEETCDPATGAAVDGEDPCDAATETCNEDTDTCDAGIPCDSDDDCDDADACNGTETCNLTSLLCEDGTALECDNGLFCDGEETCDATAGCQDGEDPCNATTESCDEETDTCGAITNLVLTDGLDVLTGTSGNESVFGDDETYTSGDQINALGGIDSFFLILTDAENDIVSATELELIFIRNTFNGQQLSLSDYTGYTELWYDRGDEDLTLEDVLTAATVGITGGDGADSDYTVEFDGDLTEGDADEVSVALDGADAGDLTLEGFEVFNVNVADDNTLDSLISADLETVNITGGSSLLVNNAIAGATTVDASGSACDVEITADDVDFTYIGGSGVDIVHFGAGEFTDDDSMDGGDGESDEIVLNLDANINNPVTISNTEIISAVNSAAVTIDVDGVSGVDTIRMEYQNDTDALTFDNLAFGPALMFRGDGTDADQDFNSVTLSFADATGDADTQSIEINNRGDDGEELDDNARAVDIDTVEIDDIENVTIAVNDGGTATLQTLNGAEIETLAITVETADGTFEIADALESTVVTEVDASASTGGVNVDASNSDEDNTMTGGAGDDTLTAGDGEDELSGGAGEDTLTGGVAADTIDGGDDDDTINGGDGIDEIDGGAGADTFQYDAANADATDADLVNGFTVGSSGDVIAIAVATAGGGVAANLTDNVLVNIAGSADNSFIVDSAGTGYASFAAAEAAVEAVNAATTDYALVFFNTGTSRIEVYIDADSSAAGAGVLLAAFEDIDNDTDADDFLADFVAGNYDTY